MKTSRFLTALVTISFISTAFAVSAYKHSRLAEASPDNHPPVANNDTYSRHLPGYIGSFTANDSDPDGDPLPFSIITQPAHGTLTFDYGTINDHPWYTPAAGFSGQDSLVYQICDPSNACATATVTINVPNQTPIAVNDSATLHLPGYLGYLMTNDSDPDGDPLTFLVTTQPVHGTLSYDYGPGYSRPWYTPASGFSGMDSLVYRICDNFGACATATVTIKVTNKIPVAVNDSYTLHLPRYLGYLTTNDSDPDGDPLTFLVTTQPAHGTLSYDYGPGYSRPWYTPASGFSGVDSLVYRICDNFGACATATVTIKVTNKIPVAVNDSYTLHLPRYLGYLTTNDSDPDGDPLTFLVTTQPAHGTLSYDYGPGYSRPWYTPASGFSGVDSLVYRICDNFGACATATVTIKVTNKIPVAVNDSYTLHLPRYLGYLTTNDS